MLSFIIYENDENKKKLYERIIKNFLYTSEDCYRVYEFNEKTSNLNEKIKSIEGVRIFLIDVDIANSKGIEFAKKIRYEGDFISPIILLTSKDRRYLVDRLRNVLFLDIIEHDDDFVHNLLLNLKDAYEIVTRHSVFTFSIFDEVYRIPYNDIYYIKKNMNDDSVTIYTKDDSYLHYTTVKMLDEVLKNDLRFFKTHRSCIINLYNVVSYDRSGNKVVFKNGMTTNLIARNKKKLLAERLKDYNNDSTYV